MSLNFSFLKNIDIFNFKLSMPYGVGPTNLLTESVRTHHFLDFKLKSDYFNNTFKNFYYL